MIRVFAMTLRALTLIPLWTLDSVIKLASRRQSATRSSRTTLSCMPGAEVLYPEGFHLEEEKPGLGSFEAHMKRFSI